MCPYELLCCSRALRDILSVFRRFRTWQGMRSVRTIVHGLIFQIVRGAVFQKVYVSCRNVAGASVWVSIIEVMVCFWRSTPPNIGQVVHAPDKRLLSLYWYGWHLADAPDCMGNRFPASVSCGNVAETCLCKYKYGFGLCMCLLCVYYMLINMCYINMMCLYTVFCLFAVHECSSSCFLLLLVWYEYVLWLDVKCSFLL